MSYAEQCALGAAIMEPERAGELADALDPEMFTDDFHRALFVAISDLYWKGEGFDVVTLANKFPEKRDYLVEIAELASVNTRLPDYIRVIRENWQLGKMEGSLRKILYAEDGPTGKLRQLEELCSQHRRLLDARESSGPDSFTAAFAGFQDWLRTREEPGTGTGFSRLDRMTGGFLPGSVFTLAARPGGGKTDFALNLAMNAAKSGARTLYFSMEMTTLQLMQRVAAKLLKINSVRIRDQSLTDDERRAVDALTQDIRKMDALSFLDEARISPAGVWRQVELYKPRLVIIDHIGLMKRPEMRDQYKALGLVSNDLKQIALKSKISIVQLAQMNRQVEARKDGEPNLSDLRESGDLEQDSDFVGFLSPRLGENRELCGSEYADVNLYLRKNRHGRTGKLGFKWQPQYHSYTEVEGRWN